MKLYKTDKVIDKAKKGLSLIKIESKIQPKSVNNSPKKVLTTTPSRNEKDKRIKL